MQLKLTDFRASAILKAISQPKRISILMLCKEEKSYQELAQSLKLSRSTVSYHIDYLISVGLITQRKDWNKGYSVFKTTEDELCFQI